MKPRAWHTLLGGWFCLIAVGCGPAGESDSGAGSTDSGSADSGIVSTERPSERSDIAGVADPITGTLVIFGGDDGPIVDQIPSPSYLNETWVFEPGFGWAQVTAAMAPAVRGRHAAAYDPNAGRMLLFGGRFRPTGMTGNYTLYNDTWAFDFAGRTWTLLHGGIGTAPAPRYFAAAVYAPGTDLLWVYGGGTNTSAVVIQPATDVWRFDGSTWEEVATSGTGPSARVFVSYTYDSTRNRMVVFGGQPGDFVSAAFNDLYALDLATGAWTQLDAGTGPIGRFNAMLTYDPSGDRYLLTGGHGDFVYLNDVWAYSPAGGGWSLINQGDTFTGAPLGCLGNPQQIPADYVIQDLSTPDRRSGGLFQVLGPDAWLFGGEGDCSEHFDDTWRLDLATGEWTEVISARSGESCERQGNACTCLCL